MRHATSEESDARDGGDEAFFRRYAVTVALGVPGLLALIGLVYVQLGSVSALPLPRSVVAVLSALTPGVLLLLACAIGAGLAPRLGFRSHVTDRVTSGAPIWPALRPELGRAVGLGVATAVVALAFDAVTGGFGTVAGGRDAVIAVVSSVPVRFLYGGVTEELLVRYGLLTLLAFAGSRLTDGHVTPAVAWVAIAVSALLFGLGHLPNAATLGPLTPAAVGRILLLNGIAGVAFGWLYWRESLEAAMVAHVAFHVVVVAVSLVLVA